MTKASRTAQKRRLAKSFFPATAMPDRDWWSALWPEPERVLRALGIEPGMTAADLCCGDGYFTVPLARIVEGRVYGLDVDPDMIEKTRNELERNGESVLQLICADARELSGLISSNVDYALIANTFHGVPEKAEMARAVASIIIPGGQFAVVNWLPLPREETVVLDQPRGPKTEMRMSPDEVRSVIEPAGFRLDRVIDLPPFHYGAVFRLVDTENV
jgi:predicted methyltransferase